MDLKAVSQAILGPEIFRTQVANLPTIFFFAICVLVWVCCPKPPVVGHKNLAGSILIGIFRVAIYVRKLLSAIPTFLV